MLLVVAAARESECEYSVPEKRVNHAKLLCQKFDRLEGRLSTIEGELSWLTALYKSLDCRQGIDDCRSNGSVDENAIGTESPLSGTPASESLANRRIIRGDQYHGPGTLVSLCCELKETILAKEKMVQPFEKSGSAAPSDVEGIDQDNSPSVRNDEQNTIPGGDTCTELLERLCFVASFEPPCLDIPEHAAIRLPPKQLLLMVLPQFFSQVDYSTDVFVESHLAANIERVYSQSPTFTDDVWAICFNTIILLVLGSESSLRGSDPLIGSQFLLPFFHAMRAALHQAPFLTTSRLINVQALALLSIAAERYYPVAKGRAVFAQACLLARLTGLHQSLAMSADICEDEALERFKTFMSLHLRDKTLSITSFSICWLPSFDRSLSLQLIPSMFADRHIAGRISLAEIQEQLYRHLSVETSQPPQQSNNELVSICRKLDIWASNHGLYTTLFSSSHEAELQLRFLATRMLAYSCSRDETHGRTILNDARASCLILLVSYEKHDQDMLSMLQYLRGPSTTTSRAPFCTEQDPLRATNGTANRGRLTSLIDAFPIMAFFQLTKHILWPQSFGNMPSRFGNMSNNDLELLQKVHHCFIEVNSQTQSQNYASQVERTFGHVLEVIKILRHGRVDQTRRYNPPNPTPPTWTPPSSGRLGSTTGDFSAAISLSGIDTPWDLFNIPFTDTMVNMSSDKEGNGEKRKRPRTSSIDSPIDAESQVPCLPGDWSSVLNLEEQTMRG
ncbi:hypothetical protein DL765_007954 [Monosporascus sp. GIB2]|nr:hypothetical protein DL765_007954 [Monosporascus sp. GIB2]